MRKIRAALYIMQCYRRYKLRQYLLQLRDIGTETKQLYQHYNNRTTIITPQQRAYLDTWPRPPKTLERVVEIIKRAYRRWRALQLLRRIPKEQWAEFRLKVIAAGALSGKRANYGLDERWQGNYLALAEWNAGNSNRFINTMRQKLPPGQQTILFSARICKASNSFLKKSADRLLVVTEEAIFNADPAKMNLINPKGVPIGELAGVGISKGNDQLMVLQVRGGNDFILALVDSNTGGDQSALKTFNRVGELLAIILKQYFMYVFIMISFFYIYSDLYI